MPRTNANTQQISIQESKHLQPFVCTKFVELSRFGDCEMIITVLSCYQKNTWYTLFINIKGAVSALPKLTLRQTIRIVNEATDLEPN